MGFRISLSPRLGTPCKSVRVSPMQPCRAGKAGLGPWGGSPRAYHEEMNKVHITYTSCQTASDSDHGEALASHEHSMRRRTRFRPRHWQVEKTSSPQLPGSGLSLAICQRPPSRLTSTLALFYGCMAQCNLQQKRFFFDCISDSLVLLVVQGRGEKGGCMPPPSSLRRSSGSWLGLA